MDGDGAPRGGDNVSTRLRGTGYAKEMPREEKRREGSAVLLTALAWMRRREGNYEKDGNCEIAR